MVARCIQKKNVYVTMVALAFAGVSSGAVRVTVVKESLVLEKEPSGKLSEIRHVSTDPLNIIINGNSPKVKVAPLPPPGSVDWTGTGQETAPPPPEVKDKPPIPVYKANRSERLGDILDKWSNQSGKAITLGDDLVSKRFAQMNILDDMTFSTDVGGSLLTLVSAINKSIRSKGFLIVVVPTAYGFKLEVKSDY